MCESVVPESSRLTSDLSGAPYGMVRTSTSTTVVRVGDMHSRHAPRVAKYYAVESQSLRALHCIGQSHVQELYKDIWLGNTTVEFRDRRSQNWIRDCESALRYAALVQTPRLHARVIVG